MKQWHVTHVSGTAQDLEAALQKIKDNDRASIMGVTQGPGPYNVWFICWHDFFEPEYTNDELDHLCKCGHKFGVSHTQERPHRCINCECRRFEAAPPDALPNEGRKRP